jgi:phage/conjugal plasmid C-4 type zinc finger TraR family protein
MADPADIASDYAAALNERALSARVRYEGESRGDCIECGAEIPPRRRAAIPGVQLCVDCQSEQEVKGRV